MTNLTVFNNDGLEIVIDTVTGESFASINGYVRMSGKPRSTIQNRVNSQPENSIKMAQIPTVSGLQAARLIPASLIFEWAWDDCPELAKKM